MGPIYFRLGDRMCDIAAAHPFGDTASLRI